MLKIILPKPIIRIERWKYSKIYGIYVSNLGNFRNKEKQPIKPKVNSSGYLVIKTKYGMDLAHRIVATTWFPTEGMLHLTVDHLDHNKRNNAVYNLEWVTEEENLRRAEEDFVDMREPVVENTSTTITSPTTTPSADPDGKVMVRAYKGAKGTKGGILVQEFTSFNIAAEWLKSNNKTVPQNETIESLAVRIQTYTTSNSAHYMLFWERA